MNDLNNQMQEIIPEETNNEVVPSELSFYFNTEDRLNKEKQVNTSSIKGYFGKAKFKNNSTSKAEMFSSSCEINQSSK